MDHEPWQEPDDDWWRFPRSWQEVRERWHSDYFLRVVIGLAVVFVIAVVTALLGFGL